MNTSIHTAELTLVPESFDDYVELKRRAYSMAISNHRVIEKKSDEKSFRAFVDEALSSHGIKVEYHENCYGRYFIRVIINPSKVLGGDDIPKLWKTTDRNIKSLLKKLRSYIKDYFNTEYKLNDFKLTRVDYTMNINVGNQEQVSNYIKVLRSIGKVKGLVPKYKKNNKWIDKSRSFDLKCQSGNFEFSAYDKYAQSNKKAAKGILRIEIRLMRLKFKHGKTSNHIVDAAKRSEERFMNNLIRIIPKGNYHTKKKALAMIKDEIATVIIDKRAQAPMLEKMIKLIELVPKKKSLYLAQKALNVRNINKVMEVFEKLNLSPVTISKNMKLKYLESLYSYIEK